MDKKYLIHYCFVCLTLFIATNICATQPSETVLKEKVDQIASYFLDRDWGVGMVIGVIDNNESYTFKYGIMSDDNKNMPDENTVFEIGSVTKVFTALLSVDMAEEGIISLNDPVKKYLPEAVNVPRMGDREITFADISTHYSGLPRIATNMDTSKGLNDPYAEYTIKDLYSFLSLYKLKYGPGEKYEYSNLGMGLLSHVLSLAGKKKFEQLLTEHILQPLKMNNTGIILTTSFKKNMAIGHNYDLVQTDPWYFNVHEGCGALKSTVNDLMKFLKAQITKNNGQLASAIGYSQKIQHIISSDEAVAMGWHISRKTDILWHNGATGGFNSFIGLQIDNKTAVVVLTNYMSVFSIDVATNIGMNILNILSNRPVKLPPIAQVISIDPAKLKKYTGKYRISDKVVLVYKLYDGVLYEESAGPESRARLYPESQIVFNYRIVPAQVRFEENKDGNITGLTVIQSDKEIPAVRLK